MVSANRYPSSTAFVAESDGALERPKDASPSTVGVLPPSTFAARYCAHRRIAADKFQAAIFERALYPLARWVRPFLGFLPNYFAADRAFLAAVGRARSMRDVESAILDFADHRSAYRFLRKRLRLRVSASTVWTVANHFLKQPAEHAVAEGNRFESRSPFLVTQPARSASQVAADRASRAAEEAEIVRLRQEVARLSTQCDLMRRAVGVFGEMKTPPASYS